MPLVGVQNPRHSWICSLLEINTLWGLETVEDSKQCIKCGEWKPSERFAFRSERNGKGTEQRNDCKDCQRENAKIVRELRKLHPPPDPETYVCPACGRDKSHFKGWKKSPFVLDHCHITGKFRDYICQYCNNTVGYADENPDILRRQADYLERHGRPSNSR